jgi:hypothetical protein
MYLKLTGLLDVCLLTNERNRSRGRAPGLATEPRG